jgi:hypothetical protein
MITLDYLVCSVLVCSISNIGKSQQGDCQLICPEAHKAFGFGSVSIV